MNRFYVVGSLILFIFSGAAYGAEEANTPVSRTCNLQGREIALRVSEEVSAGLTSMERTKIADIAEQVCMDYAENANALSVITRPTRGEPEVSSSEVSADTSTSNAAVAEEEDSGLFGDLKIIDSENRVRRPGLKRR